MKKKLLLLSLLMMTSCSIFQENYREVKFNLEGENQINLIIFEEKYPFIKNRYLKVYGNDYPLKGKDCEDAELKEFSKNLWFEIAKQNNLSEIKSGTIFLLKKQVEAMPEYCNYGYSREDDGEWTEY